MSLKVAHDLRLEAKLSAFPHQATAVEAVKDLTYCAVFHEQGLGKTKIAIDLGLSWLAAGIVDSFLIITKKALVENWRSEIAAHCHLRTQVLVQDRRENFFAFNSPARLYLTHYETMLSEESRLKLFLKTRRVGVICDEAQKLKNPESNLTQCMFRLASGFVRRVIMTGTPVANRPYDVWALIWFLDQGASLGNDFPTFRAELDFSRSLETSNESREKFAHSLEGIYRRISGFAVRETKLSAGINLPEKEILNVHTDFEPLQERLYTQYREELRARVQRDGEVVVDDAEDVLKRLLRLVQVASNPAVVDDAYDGTPGKLPLLKELVQRARSDGTKVIVWTSFTENVDYLAKSLEEFGSVSVHGKLSMEERNSALSRFKKPGAPHVLVATPGAAKEGHTLTLARYAIFFDRGFSLDDYLQAQDRIHRISQTGKCYVYNLLMRNSIDEWIDGLLAAKSLAARLAQGDISAAEYQQDADYSFLAFLTSVLNSSQNP
ncbi:DEAD/DEAH box helicase [Verrucomicrobiota bacterium sgz303538]